MSPMTARPNHLLVITQDQLSVKACREQGDEPGPREFLEFAVHCEADRSEFLHDCMAWWECDCPKTMTDEQRDALDDEDDGPCPQSPAGYHKPMMGMVMHPSHDCWAQVCEHSSEVVDDLADKHRLGPGTYRIWVHPDNEELDFELAEILLGTLSLPGDPG